MWIMQEVWHRSDSAVIKYTVKNNPENKGGYITPEFQEKKFSTIKYLQSKLCCFESIQMMMGYLTPGKGKQFLLTCGEDVLKMYKEHEEWRSINLWMKVKAKHQKRPSESSGIPSTSQTKRAKVCESHLEKMDELQKTVGKTQGGAIFSFFFCTVSLLRQHNSARSSWFCWSAS